MANVIEEAKSGRASCRTCKKAIAKGELRFGEEAPNAFGDTPSIRWHHLLCAAQKLPGELKAVLDTYPEAIPNRAELDQAMTEAMSKGRAKAAGYPHVDKAPIAKDSLRVAVEREIDTGAMVTRGAGYLLPKCVVENLENVGGDKAEFITALRANSRLLPADLDAAVAEIG